MSFVKKIWKDRISQFPNRRTINDGHTVKRVTVGRDEGVVTEEGTPFDATEMNDLENRIFAAIEQGGGGGGSSGTYDYSELFNKPRVNNVELNGNKSTADLHINYDDLENKPDIPENATELPISANDSTNTKTYIDMGLSGKQDAVNQSIDKIGSFLLGKSGDNKTGNINLSESIENARGLIFSISLANDTAPVRSTIFAPIYALTYYGVMQDYTIGNDRNYWNINKVNNTTLSVTNTSISSGSNFYVTVWIVR